MLILLFIGQAHACAVSGYAMEPYEVTMRTYKRKTTRDLDIDTIQIAVNAVVVDGESIRGAAIEHGLKRQTLQDYVGRARRGEPLQLGSHASRLVFQPANEKLLSDYLLKCSAMFYGLSPIAARKLAYEYAVAMQVTYPPSWSEHETAGKDWFTGFMKRNGNLSIRLAEATSLARASSFNRSTVDSFFDNLESVMATHKFSNGRIFNLDETGCTTVPRAQKVVAAKGMHQVGQIVSRERGELVTMVGIIGADGNALPPAFIFPRVRFDRTRMMANASDDCLGISHPSGWMTADKFLLILEHFAKHAHPSLDDKVLLVMDNHESHLSVEAIDFCRSKGIVLLTIPPHTSSKLQPLDVAVYGPFKGYYSKACAEWMHNHPGKPLQIYDLPGLICKAWDRAATRENIKADFRTTGICKLDRNVFTDSDYMMSEVTNRPDPTLREEDITPEPPCAQADHGIHDDHQTTEPGPSTAPHTASPAAGPSATTPEDIRPYPKAGPRKQSNRGRRRGKSMIATSTPEKNQLEERKKAAAARKCGRVKRSLPFTQQAQKKKRAAPVPVASSDEDSPPEGMTVDTTEDSCSEEDDFDIGEPCRQPVEGDFVLVDFEKVLYVGRLLSDMDKDGDYQVSYLRKSAKLRDTFVYPNVLDECTVRSSVIRNILPTPKTAANRRLSGFIHFGISFSSVNIR